MTPRENFYILGYRGPNENFQDVTKHKWNLLYVVKVSDPEDETITHGSPYNSAMLNSPEKGHLGKMIISPNWWNQLWWNMWCWNRDRICYLYVHGQTQRSSNCRDTVETVSRISIEEILKLGLPVLGVFLHCSQKRSTLDNSPWRFISFYLIKSKRFQVLKNRVSLTNPRSASSGTRTDTSNR